MHKVFNLCSSYQEASEIDPDFSENDGLCSSQSQKYCVPSKKYIFKNHPMIFLFIPSDIKNTHPLLWKSCITDQRLRFPDSFSIPFSSSQRSSKVPWSSWKIRYRCGRCFFGRMSFAGHDVGFKLLTKMVDICWSFNNSDRSNCWFLVIKCWSSNYIKLIPIVEKCCQILIIKLIKTAIAQDGFDSTGAHFGVSIPNPPRFGALVPAGFRTSWKTCINMLSFFRFFQVQ